jgi:hypothetical protein
MPRSAAQALALVHTCDLRHDYADAMSAMLYAARGHPRPLTID